MWAEFGWKTSTFYLYKKRLIKKECDLLNIHTSFHVLFLKKKIFHQLFFKAFPETTGGLCVCVRVATRGMPVFMEGFIDVYQG